LLRVTKEWVVRNRDRGRELGDTRREVARRRRSWGRRVRRVRREERGRGVCVWRER